MVEALLAQVGAVLLITCAVGGLLRAPWMLEVLLPAGILATGSSLALRWYGAGQGPFLTLFEVVMSNVFSLALIYYLAWRRWERLRNAAGTVLAVVGLLALWTLFLPRQVTLLPPSFHNPWLWAHVLSGKLFLGFYLIATGLAMGLLLDRRRSTEARQLDAQIWRFASLAFVFDTLMLVTGAVWANDAWGRYWNWDPLESSAFLTWVALALLLHLRAALRFPQAWQWASVCAVFLMAFLTFFGMPFLSLAPHKGIL